MPESDPVPTSYHLFLELDLATQENRELADYGSRILKMLEWAQVQHNDFLVATLDDFLGVVYVLIFANCNNPPFQDRTGPIEVQTVVKRAGDVAKGRVRTSGRWLAGFHFNSALFRIAATYHRGLKVVSGKETSGLWKGQLLPIVEPAFPRWQHKELDKIHDEVNQLKHDGEGLFEARSVTRKQAELAVEELLTLFELWVQHNSRSATAP